MKRTSIFLVLFQLHYLISTGQVKDIVQPDEITNSVHKANIGRITFMPRNIPLEQYSEADFLKTFKLTREATLNIRVFMNNSITNYLHQLAPELPAEVLVKSGNFQFSFYIDGKFIYKENLHSGAGVNKNTATTFRVPLTSITGEDWWAMYVWDRFKMNGGEKALTEGTHDLKIEIRPYLKPTENSEIKVGDLIAEGQLQLIIKTPIVTAKQIAIQAVKPSADWKIATSTYDKEKIRELNKAIANYSLKEITSIVVIKDGQLLIEEYFNGANRNTLHDTRSATKSFTSTLVGIAIKEGYIKSEAAMLNSFYDLRQFSNYAGKKDSVKIKDLLTMSSAFDGSDANGSSPGNEENMYPTDNWIKFALDLPMDSIKKNGGKWDYFTAGVVLLGDILDKAVPGGLEKYADEKLLKPLNILKYQWQYTPQKVVNTAGSLAMSSLDYAKFGQLYKNGGTWNGKQIIPSDWVDKTFTRQIQITERDNQFYGYLFWNKTVRVNGKDFETFYCAGNGGNEILMFKDLPLTIVITSKAYNKPYAHPQADKIVGEYLLPAIIK
ncbi:MAG TPA: serine hydrolase [Puia sp.]|nr:serine hydrolase [Puia sp.]